MSPRERVIDGIRSQKKEKGLGSSAEVKNLALNKRKRIAYFLRQEQRGQEKVRINYAGDGAQVVRSYHT